MYNLELGVVDSTLKDGHSVLLEGSSWWVVSIVVTTLVQSSVHIRGTVSLERTISRCCPVCEKSNLLGFVNSIICKNKHILGDSIQIYYNALTSVCVYPSSSFMS